MTKLPIDGLLRLEARGARHTNFPLPDWFEKLTLVFYDTEGNETVLLQGNYELQPLLEWLEENEDYIRREPPYVTQLPGETIGQTKERTSTGALTNDSTSEEIVDLVAEANWQYHSHHYIPLGFNGVNVPALYIGPGLNGVEVCNAISDKDGEDAWRYIIDVNDFFGSLPSL